MSQISVEDSNKQRPWQLLMFERSLKKQLKLAALKEFLPEIADKRCLLVSCGDNNGALNWHFRGLGGDWEWGDVAGENLAEMSAFLESEVKQIPETDAPYPDNAFDCIVAIDVLEHLVDDQPFLKQMRRILRTDGHLIVTVPNGDPGLLANRLKGILGMTPEVYGHRRAGYTIAELELALRQAQMKPLASGGYSRFFTEMMELTINFGYVFLLNRKGKQRSAGEIAPTSAGQMKSHGLAFKLYSFFFPLLKLVSQMDRFLSRQTNNAVIVAARKADA